MFEQQKQQIFSQNQEKRSSKSQSLFQQQPNRISQDQPSHFQNNEMINGLQQSSDNPQIEVEVPKQIIWRRNAPYFYQTLYTNEMQWPSLAVQWKPDIELSFAKRNIGDPYHIAYVTYGTSTSEGEQNYIVFGKVRIPNQEYLQKQYKQKPLSKSQSVKKNEEAVESQIQVDQMVQHPGDVNRIRYNPNMTELLASRTATGDILIINCHKMQKGKNGLKPYIVLKGHQGEGYAIDWNYQNKMNLVAGSYSGKLSIWDTNLKENSNEITPLSNFFFHQREIQDVSFTRYHDSIFASCDDAGYSAFWDTRSSQKPVHYLKNHEGNIFSLQFSPVHEFLWASAGQDGVAKIWDVRNTSEPISKLETENRQEISHLKWSFDDKSTIWLVTDKLVTAWDICESKPIFVHGGHLKKVNDMSMHPNLPDVFASVDDDNSIQVFQPNSSYK